MADTSALAKEIDNLVENISWTDIPNSETMFDQFVEKLQAVMCKHTGHLPTQDHCGYPEHDYCGRCMTATPGQAAR